jgi:hypothetical protein
MHSILQHKLAGTNLLHLATKQQAYELGLQLLTRCKIPQNKLLPAAEVSLSQQMVVA